MSEITDWEPLATGTPVTVEQYISTLQPPTDDSDPETYWERQYGKALTQLEEALLEVENLNAERANWEKLAHEKNDEFIESIKQFYEIKKENKELSQKNSSLLRDNKQLQEKFTCFKADAITSLKAIDLCIIATITTQRQVLTHRQRNFRMRHIHQIIVNEVADFSDRKIVSYEDDF
jgi:predicted transcriptional regulator